MTTGQLIDAVNRAQAAYARGLHALQGVAQMVDDLRQAVATASQALHDDLAANGPACLVDEPSAPAVQVDTAQDPDGFAVTSVRTAG